MRHPILKWGYIFVIPGVIAYFLFTFFPTLRCFIQSFHLIRATTQPWVFNGFNNYVAIFKDSVIWQSLRNTFQYVAMTVPVGTAVSLFVAINLYQITRFKGLFRALYFIPSIAGVITMGIVFTWMYEPYSGLLNLVLSKLGMQGLGWLRDRYLALPSIAAMTVWRTMGYNVVILLAGLLAIPRDFYEAADIDGAGFLTKHFRITIPLLAPAIWFIVIDNSIRDLKVFSEVFVMTGGGPGHATTTIGFRVYQNAFNYLSFGKASANAIILLLIILVVTIIQFRFFEEKTRVSY